MCIIHHLFAFAVKSNIRLPAGSDTTPSTLTDEDRRSIISMASGIQTSEIQKRIPSQTTRQP